ncbi:hypothetical protein DRN93_03940 [archaeon]|nr:MAG: hypothetical protein DRN93_03940 [archaeon]
MAIGYHLMVNPSCYCTEDMAGKEDKEDKVLEVGREDMDTYSMGLPTVRVLLLPLTQQLQLLVRL